MFSGQKIDLKTINDTFEVVKRLTSNNSFYTHPKDEDIQIVLVFLQSLLAKSMEIFSVNNNTSALEESIKHFKKTTALIEIVKAHEFRYLARQWTDSNNLKAAAQFLPTNKATVLQKLPKGSDEGMVRLTITNFIALMYESVIQGLSLSEINPNTVYGTDYVMQSITALDESIEKEEKNSIAQNNIDSVQDVLKTVEATFSKDQNKKLAWESSVSHVFTRLRFKKKEDAQAYANKLSNTTGLVADVVETPITSKASTSKSIGFFVSVPIPIQSKPHTSSDGLVMRPPK